MLANTKKAKPYDLTLRDIFLALANDVPDPAGGEKAVPNPYKTWKDVNSALPDNKIEVLGPPPTSGTRDAFVELDMEGGCKSFAWIKEVKKKDKKTYKALCHTIREDGHRDGRASPISGRQGLFRSWRGKISKVPKR